MKYYTLLCCLLIALGAGSPTTSKAQVDINDSLALVDLYNSTNGAGWKDNTNWLTTEPVSNWYAITVLDTRVTSISLGVNNLTGIIPASIGNLVKLEYLELLSNQLSGSIPSSIGNLVNLYYLHLNNNQLSGGLIFSFNKLKHLYSMDLSHNQLSQSNNADFSMDESQDLYGDVSFNQSTFNGLEFVARMFVNVNYAPQAIIPLHQNGNTLSVDAGGTLSNNTYKWFKVGDAGSTTITGDSTFHPANNGKYYVQVTNSIATELTLYSDTINFTMPALVQNKTHIGKVRSNTITTPFSVYPNPARSIIHVQMAGTALIIITNGEGKVVLTKTINVSERINVSSLAPGTYYVQNTNTGEVKKVVVVH